METARKAGDARLEVRRDGLADREAIKREIDRLMAGPPKGMPSIVIVGDDVVFGVTPIRRPT